MKKIRALIIDDETAAQRTLMGMLGEFCPQVTVVGQSINISEAIYLVEQQKPDLLFLDIQMSPYESGFDLLGRTKHLSYGVIFVTAYSQYAIKAINAAQPWAYLVKPFSSDDLMEAVRAAYKKILEKRENTPAEEDNKGIVIADSRKGQIVIRFKEILYCQSDQSVVEIIYQKNDKLEKVYTYQSLKQVHSQLLSGQFCRIHHGIVVNLGYIERFEKNGRNGIIHLEHDIRLPVSIKKTEDFEASLKVFLESGYVDPRTKID